MIEFYELEWVIISQQVKDCKNELPLASASGLKGLKVRRVEGL